MISARRREYALIAVCLVLIIVASCRVEDSSPTTNTAAGDTIVSSTPPYQTREPERYRATRTITTVATDGRTQITKSTTTRDGELRRNDLEVMSKRVIILDGPTGRFVLYPDEKIYADVSASGQPLVGVVDDYGSDDSSAEKFLHADDGNSSYQSLGKETIAGRNAKKYRVVVNNSNSANVTPSETLIWIDQTLGLIIRSETKSSDGSRSTMELSEISLEVDSSLFQLPSDFQKLTLSELVLRVNGVK